LGEVSQKITKAISFVNEIAIQTNFLAINASLEASRQGHSDLSFAIVAEDVGELANRSIVATKEMEGMLSQIQQETNAVMADIASSTNQVAESASLAITAKDNLRQIGDISHEIDGLMHSIATATASQVQTSEGVASLMQDISHIAQRTLATSGEVSKFMKSTKTYSSDLQKSLALFKS
jgi:twitching motility protein PilJ